MTSNRFVIWTVQRWKLHMCTWQIPTATQQIFELVLWNGTQNTREKEPNRHKQKYNHKVKCSKLEPSDLVLMHKHAFQGKYKTADHWENIIHSFPLIFTTFLSTLSLYWLEISAPNTVNVFNLGWIYQLHISWLEKSTPSQVIISRNECIWGSG